MNKICKNQAASIDIESDIQSKRENLLNSLDNTYFSKTTYQTPSEGPSGSSTSGFTNTREVGDTIVFPTEFKDTGSGINTMTLYSAANGTQIYQESISYTTKTITKGVALRGIRYVHGEYYPNENRLSYTVYRAK